MSNVAPLLSMKNEGEALMGSEDAIESALASSATESFHSDEISRAPNRNRQPIQSGTGVTIRKLVIFLICFVGACAVAFAGMVFYVSNSGSSNQANATGDTVTPIKTSGEPKQHQEAETQFTSAFASEFEATQQRAVLSGDDVVIDPNELSPGMMDALYGDSGVQNSGVAEQQVESRRATAVDPLNSDRYLNALPQHSNEEQVAQAASDASAAIRDVSTLKLQIETIDRLVAQNAEQAIVNQRAITQTAQVLVSLKAVIESSQKEISQIKKLTAINSEMIKELDGTVSRLNGGRSPGDIRSDATATIQSSRSTLSPTTSKNVVNSEIQTQQRATAQNVPQRIREPVRIDQLWVMAVHSDKAVVTDANNRQYLLKAGTAYKNLGQVKSVDVAESKVFGRFENGTDWVIGKRSI